MAKVFYTSDLHFGHDNIIKYCNRPFINNIDMNRQIVLKWNKKVNKNDIVYILGDFAFNNRNLSCRDIEDLANSLNGHKILIKGNHDNWVSKLAFNVKCFDEIISYKEIKDMVNGKNKDVVLCHYPIEDWNGMFYGSIHLHGHLHDQNTKLDLKNRYNVGIDRWNYEPVTLQEIVNELGYYNPEQLEGVENYGE